MTLDKAIQSGKEHRKQRPKTKHLSKANDSTLVNNGSDPTLRRCEYKRKPKFNRWEESDD